MTPARYEHLRELFVEAGDMRPSERDRHLRERCNGDPLLRADVDSLLEADCDSLDIERASRSLWLTWLTEAQSTKEGKEPPALRKKDA